MYNKFELSLPKQEQIFEGENQLEVFKKYGIRAAKTDLAIIRGLYPAKEYFDEYIPADESLKGRIGCAVFENPDGTSDGVYGYFSFTYSDNGKYGLLRKNYRGGGIRPILSLPEKEFEQIIKISYKGYNGVKLVNFGYLPQYVAPVGLQSILTREFQGGRLKRTGNVYTLDKNRSFDQEKNFEPEQRFEYEYDGKRYIWVDSNFWNDFDDYQLSDGSTVYASSRTWIEVSPVTWLVDEKTKKLIAKNILLSGIKYDDIKYYFDNYMLKELLQSTKLTITSENKSSEKLKDMLIFLKESGLELTEEQEKIISNNDEELRRQRQEQIREKNRVENQKKEEWLNSPENPTNIRLEQLKTIRLQVEKLKSIKAKYPRLLSDSQNKLIEFIEMVDLSNSLPHEVDSGMNPEIRNWYNKKYEEYTSKTNDDLPKLK